MADTPFTLGLVQQAVPEHAAESVDAAAPGIPGAATKAPQDCPPQWPLTPPSFWRPAAVLLSRAAPAAPATAQASQAPTQVPTPDAEVNSINPSLLEFYNEAFRSWGLTYQPAAGVVYYDYTDTSGQTVTATCNGTQIQTGIWGQYCNADQVVYLDYTQAQNELNARGSYIAGAL